MLRQEQSMHCRIATTSIPFGMLSAGGTCTHIRNMKHVPPACYVCNKIGNDHVPTQTLFVTSGLPGRGSNLWFSLTVKSCFSAGLSASGTSSQFSSQKVSITALAWSHQGIWSSAVLRLFLSWGLNFNSFIFLYSYTDDLPTPSSSKTVFTLPGMFQSILSPPIHKVKTKARMKSWLTDCTLGTMSVSWTTRLVDLSYLHHRGI